MDFDQYESELRKMDWQYHRSDDYTFWAQMNRRHQALVSAQKRIDPTGAIWNAIVPEANRIKPKE